MRNSYYLQIRKPYYNRSRIKTSPIVAQKLCSLAANAYQNCGYTATYLTKKGYPSYSPLNTSRMSLVFFAALVDPSGLPGPFLRFSGGPAGGLFVRRLLLLTCVQFCSFSAWAGAGWVGAGSGTGASPGARTGTGTGELKRIMKEINKGLTIYISFIYLHCK
jgi:hypothetical protein